MNVSLSLSIRLLISIVLGLFLLSTTTLTFAASYSVSPLVIDRTVSPRESETVPITITNSTGGPVRLYATVNTINVDENGAITEFVEPSMVDTTVTVTSWLQISRQRIELPAGETFTTELTLKIPAKIEPGEYHAFIGFPDASNRPEAEAQVATGNVPGVVVRIAVGDDSFSLLRMSKFYIDRFITTKADRTAVITLANTGTQPVTPTGEIIFYNTKGIEVNAVPLTSESVTILEGGEASINVDLPSDLRFGKYKAFLNMQYGNNQTAQLQDTTFFYIIPIYHLLAIFMTLLVLALILALKVHRQYARVTDDDFAKIGAIPMYVRGVTSEPQDHDIDLKNQNSK